MYSLSVAHAYPPTSSIVMLVKVAVVVAARDLAHDVFGSKSPKARQLSGSRLRPLNDRS